MEFAGRIEAARADEAHGDPAAAHRLGLFLEQSGDLEGAEEAYRRAEASGDPQGSYGLAELYALRGDTDAARAAELRGDTQRPFRAPPQPGRQQRARATPTTRARHSLHSSPYPHQQPETAPQKRCVSHQNKRAFATQAAAREFVEWTQARYASGETEMLPMDHWYACPVAGQDHWHVSSKPQF